MNRLPKLSFLAALAVLVAWSLAVAGADEQKKMLEERVATVTVQVDQHEIRVKAMSRWKHIGSPTPAAEFYKLKEALNALSIERSLCVNSLVSDYGVKGLPTLAVPTVIPTRTPGPTPLPRTRTR